ncbi:hypothetical protein BDW69DRAFT_159152 [Aspergillus filifer]
MPSDTSRHGRCSCISIQQPSPFEKTSSNPHQHAVLPLSPHFGTVPCDIQIIPLHQAYTSHPHTQSTADPDRSEQDLVGSEKPLRSITPAGPSLNCHSTQ